MIEDAYARRAADPAVAARDSLLHPATLDLVVERDRAVWRSLARAGWTATDLPRRRVLDIGCGDGGHLLGLIRGGVQADRAWGVDRLAERVAWARARLPSGARVIEGDLADPDVAAHLPVDGFDLVCLFTVFSSVLAEIDRQALADAAWRALAPGGSVLVYDFAFDNPRNPDVRAVRTPDLRRWFGPHRPAAFEVQRVTLAPPLARAAHRWLPWFHPLLAACPPLRSHRLTRIAKAPAPQGRP